MKILALASIAVALSLTMGTAQAQSSSMAKKPAAAKKAPAKKAPARQATRKRTPAKTAKAVEAATPVESLTQRLSDAELRIAENIHTGRIQCELGADVTVTADEKHPGFFHVSSGKQRYYMHPVESRTGAIRLEDNRAGAMWLQLGNKSMLMNQKLGQRVADECATPVQREFAAQMLVNGQPSLLDDAPPPGQPIDVQPQGQPSAVPLPGQPSDALGTAPLPQPSDTPQNPNDALRK
ncbi:MAG: hypothetical protein Q4G70_15275 [Pseudomonadota bacterium]|nr:hypothetical protein [Pseudomonadota bacterium]